MRKARSQRIKIVVDPVATAKISGLRYVTDQRAGIRRKRHGMAMRYSDPKGRPLRDKTEIGRIRALAIPPRGDGRRFHRQGLSHLGRHGPGGARAAGAAKRFA